MAAKDELGVRDDINEPWYLDAAKWQEFKDRHHITDGKMSAMREAFMLYDKDRDGSVTYDEMAKAMRSLGQTPSEANVTDMCAEIDSDGNGTVDIYEFVILMTRQMREEDSLEAVKEAFKMFDLDGDDFITEKELRQMLTGMGEKLSDEEVTDIIREADTNGDGKIDLEEFIAMMMPAQREMPDIVKHLHQ